MVAQVDELARYQQSDPEDRAAVERLQAAGVFDPGIAWPSFGHPTRHDAALNEFLADSQLRAVAALELRKLIKALARDFNRPADAAIVESQMLLIYVSAFVARLELHGDYANICDLMTDAVLAPFTSANIEAFVERARSLTISTLFLPATWAATALLDAANMEPSRKFHHPLIDLIADRGGKNSNQEMRRLEALGYSNALNYDLLYDDEPGWRDLLQRLRQLAASFPDEPWIQASLARSLVQCLCRAFGDSLRHPTLFGFATLRGGEELIALWDRGGAREAGDLVGYQKPLFEELLNRFVPLPAHKETRDHVLHSIVRWLRFAEEPGVATHRSLLAQATAAFPADPYTWQCCAEGTYHVLWRELRVGRTDHRDEYLADLRNLSLEGPFPRQSDRWYFLGLIDSAEQVPYTTRDITDAAALLKEIDAQCARQTFRNIASENAVTRVLRGVEREDADIVLARCEILASMHADYPNDHLLTERTVGGLCAAISWIAESGSRKQRGVLRRVLVADVALSERVEEEFRVNHGKGKAKSLLRRLAKGAPGAQT
jgi:hypothetical protein